GAAGGEGGVDRVDAQHLAQGHAQVLRVAAGLDVAGADVVGVAAVAGAQVEVAVGAEGDGAAVVVAGVLAEGDQLAARVGVDHVRVGRRHLPLGDQVLVILRRVVGCDVGRACAQRLARVGVERAIADAGRVDETRVNSQPGESAHAVGVAGLARAGAYRRLLPAAGQSQG